MSRDPSGNAASPPPIAIHLSINGRGLQLEVAPWTTLLDLLRDRLQLTGTKKGCDHGQCGACTVLLDGKRVNSCLALAVTKDGSSITTIEGLASDGRLHPVAGRRSSSTTRSSAATARQARSALRLG